MRYDAVRSAQLSFAEARKRERRIDIEYQQKVIRRAEVDAEKLTDSPLWNAYLEMIEAVNEDDAKELEGLQAALESPEFRTAEQCQALQFKCQLLIARIQARDECIAIPKRIQGSAR